MRIVGNNQTVQQTNRWAFALYTGFFAGLIWGTLKILLYVLKFTNVQPVFLLRPFVSHDFGRLWIGHAFGLASFILLSLVAALIYAALFYRMKGPWPGVGYGVAWWALIYLVLGPAAGMVARIGALDSDTLVSDLCLFILWGVFIGYTITSEFTDERKREPV